MVSTFCDFKGQWLIDRLTFSTLTLGPWLLEDEDDAEGGTSKGDDNDVELLEDFLKGSAAGGVAPKGEIPGNPGGVPSPANNEFGPPILGAAAAVSLVCKGKIEAFRQ